MADFTPTAWVDDSVPDITAAQLNRIEAGILDAVRKFERGAALPAATAANQWHAFFATGVNGGTLYINFDGANWTKVSLGLTEVAAGGGGGGGAAWLYDQEVTAASYVDVPSLNGDTDIEYEVILDGVVNTGGVARNVTVRPNNLTANTYNFYQQQSRAAGAVTATPAAGPYDGGGLMLGYTDAANSLVLARLTLSAKSGRARQSIGRFASSTGATAAFDIRVQGRWDDTTTVINSLRVDFGGATFTGRVRVKAV